MRTIKFDPTIKCVKDFFGTEVRVGDTVVAQAGSAYKQMAYCTVVGIVKNKPKNCFDPDAYPILVATDTGSQHVCRDEEIERLPETLELIKKVIALHNEGKTIDKYDIEYADGDILSLVCHNPGKIVKYNHKEL